MEFDRLLAEVKRAVREVVEESKREDVLKLATAVEKLTAVVEKVVEVLTKLAADVEALKQDVASLRQEVAALRQDVDAPKRDMEVVKRDLKEVKAALGASGGRLGKGSEATAMELYSDALREFGVEPPKVRKERFTWAASRWRSTWPYPTAGSPSWR